MFVRPMHTIASAAPGSGRVDMSVFSGGFDSTAAEAVIGKDATGDDEVADILASLVDKSMLVADRSGRTMRYRMLETLRLYGAERLGQTGQQAEAQTRDCHLVHYVALTTAARDLQMGQRQVEGDTICLREWDNVRAAIAWATNSGNVQAGDELLAATGNFAFVQLLDEHATWSDRVVANEGTELRRHSRTYHAVAAFAMMAGDWAKVVEYCERGIANCSSPDAVALCRATMIAGYLGQGMIAEAEVSLQQAESMMSTIADPQVRYWVLYARATMAYAVYPDAMPAAVAGLAEFSHQTGAPWMLNGTRQRQANLCLRLEDYVGARHAF